MIPTDKLRQELRGRRRAIAPRLRRSLSLKASRRLIRTNRFLHARRIAAFLSVNHEIDPLPVMQSAMRSGKRVYLPVLHPFRKGRLWFVRWTENTRLVPNRFGIPEPVVSDRHRMTAQHIDLVITPLLGFDSARNRVGMGGGYYDRTFAFLRQRKYWRRPYLVGFAFQQQLCDTLYPNHWDVPLDMIVTPDNTY